MTLHIHLLTLAVRRHGAWRNVSFPMHSLRRIFVRQCSKSAVATKFSKTHPIYTWLIGCVSVKKIFNYFTVVAVV